MDRHHIACSVSDATWTRGHAGMQENKGGSLLLLVPQLLDKVKVSLDLGCILFPGLMVLCHVDVLVIVQYQGWYTVNEVWHARRAAGAVQVQHLCGKQSGHQLLDDQPFD